MPVRSLFWGSVSTVELVPKLVQHVNTSLVFGNPKDELGALRGCEDSLASRKTSRGRGRGGGAGQFRTRWREKGSNA